MMSVRVVDVRTQEYVEVTVSVQTLGACGSVCKRGAVAYLKRLAIPSLHNLPSLKRDRDQVEKDHTSK